MAEGAEWCAQGTQVRREAPHLHPWLRQLRTTPLMLL